MFYSVFHIQIIFIANIATSHEKLSSKRGQLANRLVSDFSFSGQITKFLAGSITDEHD